MKLQGFKDVDIKVDYVTYNKKQTIVRYKMLNSQVIIDIKTIIDDILTEQGISNYKTDKIDLNIPYSIDKEVTGNSLSLVIDKKRFTIRLNNMEIIPSHQQKIDFDNTHPHRWKYTQWIKFIENIFTETYGFEPIELDLRGPEGSFKRGKVLSNTKNIIDKVLAAKGLETNHESVIEYLKWAFANKGKKMLLTLALLQCDGFIQEWTFSKIKSGRGLTGEKQKARKWD